jgi:hypothetical protein
MTNQDLLDEIEYSLPRRLMTIELREKILDAVWNAITDNREEPDED